MRKVDWRSRIPKRVPLLEVVLDEKNFPWIQDKAIRHKFTCIAGSQHWSGGLPQMLSMLASKRWKPAKPEVLWVISNSFFGSKLFFLYGIFSVNQTQRRRVPAPWAACHHRRGPCRACRVCRGVRGMATSRGLHEKPGLLCWSFFFFFFFFFLNFFHILEQLFANIKGFLKELFAFS